MTQFVLVPEIKPTYDKNGNVIIPGKPALTGPILQKVPAEDLSKLHQVPQDKKVN